MKGLDLINFFLHDNIAVKIWYRADVWQGNEGMFILYKSRQDSNQKFIISLFNDDKCMIGWFNNEYEVYISSENILRVRSMNFSLWFDLKDESFVRIMYRR